MGSYFRKVEIARKHFHFQKGFKCPRLAKTFGNVFQISEVEYVTVMPSGISNVGNFHHTEIFEECITFPRSGKVY